MCQREPISEPTVVILGDWYIDENWLVSYVESYHSSAPGDVHYLSLHEDADTPLTNLCAAAGLLLALRSYLSEKVGGSTPSFLAFGIWNPRDDKLFTQVLCPDSGVTLRPPYTLSQSATKKAPRWCGSRIFPAA